MKNFKKLIKEIESEVLLWTNFWYIYLKNKDKQKENIISLCFILNLFVLIILLYSHNKTGMIPIENPKVNTLIMSLGGPKNVESMNINISYKHWNFLQDYIDKLNNGVDVTLKEDRIALRISQKIIDQIGIENFNKWEDNSLMLNPIEKTISYVESSSKSGYESKIKIEPIMYFYLIFFAILLGAIGYGCYKFYRWWYQI